jgi:HEAT repeat protein
LPASRLSGRLISLAIDGPFDRRLAMSKKALEQKLAALETLRADAASPQTFAALRKALHDPNNYYVSKAAAIAAEFALTDLIPDLLAAFDRFLINPVKSDPQSWAKNAIAKALKDFAYDDASFYVRGIKHIQLEPVWGGSEDTAATLRGACAFALTACSIPRAEAMRHLVDLLAADTEKTVRMEAALAIARLGGIESVLLLRLKALAGDREPEVIGQCFTGLLDLAPADYVPFVAGFLNVDNDVRFEAAAALAELPDPGAVTAVTAHFAKSRNQETRRAIVLSLGASRLEPARDFLLTQLADAEIEEAIACVRALAASRFREEVKDRVRSLASNRADPRLTAAVLKEFSRS